jgi:hypothetical protein
VKQKIGKGIDVDTTRYERQNRIRKQNETQQHLAIKPTQQNDSTHEQQRACTFTVAADTIDIKFRARFTDNKFGFACDVCDRLWFQNDLQSVPNTSYTKLREEFSILQF